MTSGLEMLIDLARKVESLSSYAMIILLREIDLTTILHNTLTHINYSMQQTLKNIDPFTQLQCLCFRVCVLSGKSLLCLPRVDSQKGNEVNRSAPIAPRYMDRGPVHCHASLICLEHFKSVCRNS